MFGLVRSFHYKRFSLFRQGIELLVFSAVISVMAIPLNRRLMVLIEVLQLIIEILTKCRMTRSLQIWPGP
jgi:hypothetical protein